MNSWKRHLIVPLLAMSWLTGCGNVVSECPPLFVYPPEFSTQLADELLTVKPDGAIVRAVTDYYVTRRMLEKCQ